METVFPSLKLLSLVFDKPESPLTSDALRKGFFFFVSKSEKDLLSVSLNLKVHVVDKQYHGKTYPEALKCYEKRIMPFVHSGSQTISRSVFCWTEPERCQEQWFP